MKDSNFSAKIRSRRAGVRNLPPVKSGHGAEPLLRYRRSHSKFWVKLAHLEWKPKFSAKSPRSKARSKNFPYSVLSVGSPFLPYGSKKWCSVGFGRKFWWRNSRRKQAPRLTRICACTVDDSKHFCKDGLGFHRGVHSVKMWCRYLKNGSTEIDFDAFSELFVKFWFPRVRGTEGASVKSRSAARPLPSLRSRSKIFGPKFSTQKFLP